MSASELYIQDNNSGFGVALNHKIIARKEDVQLKIGDIVQLGPSLDSPLYHIKCIEIKACISHLSPDGIDSIKQKLQIIGGVLLNDWKADCTHLIMPELLVTKFN